MTAQDKQYQVVNHTHYDTRTPKAVIDILEESRTTGKRLRLFYGEDGKVWEDLVPRRGRVGRSTGSKPIPLLIRTSRSLGGEAILDEHIVEIRESAGGKVLYKKSGVLATEQTHK